MLITVICIVVGFIALRFLGKRYFDQKYRADVVAAAIVSAFLVGMIWPLSHPDTPPVASAVVPVTPQPAVATVCYTPGAADRSQGVGLPLKQVTGRGYAGAIDTITSDPGGTQPNLSAGCSIYASGWVANMAKKGPARGVVLVVDSRDVINATPVYGVLRPDVVKFFNAPNLLRTGFAEAAIPTTGLAKGPHTIQLGALGGDGRTYYLAANPMTITLR